MRNAGDGVPYGGDLCGFAGVRWGSVGCGAERHGGRSLHWVFADSPGIFRDRRGVLRNGHNRSLHGRVRVRLDTVMICGAYCGTARGPFPTLGFSPVVYKS